MSELTTAVASIAAVTVLGQAVTLGALLDILGQNPHARLVFAVSGRETSSGYHITEVKSGAFTALDCGANSEAWTETFIQLWDVPADPGSQPMTAGKATSLLGIVEARIGLDRAALVTFEVSDGVAAMALYRPSAVRIDADQVTVDLTPAASSCKPRDRWLAGMPTAADVALHTRSQARAQHCCGTPANIR